jgi:hypothetical protein
MILYYILILYYIVRRPMAERLDQVIISLLSTPSSLHPSKHPTPFHSNQPFTQQPNNHQRQTKHTTPLTTSSLHPPLQSHIQPPTPTQTHNNHNIIPPPIAPNSYPGQMPNILLRSRLSANNAIALGYRRLRSQLSAHWPTALHFYRRRRS